jgi:ribosomal protein L11 methylase PrmA
MPTEKTDLRVAGSFRDPSGIVFVRDGHLYRQVNHYYRSNYELLVGSGLSGKLTTAGLLVRHDEVTEPGVSEAVWKVTRPELIPFISYPYEWSFSQLKDAALATLAIQKASLDHNLSLKDASAYNIQYLRGRPLLIDTLSFEPWVEGKPWVAYRQFCQHFLAPLALMSCTDVRLSQLLRVYIDGIPLDLASALLPGRTKLSPGLATHIHLHAGVQQRYADKPAKPTAAKVSRNALMGIIQSLESTVAKLSWKPEGTEWADYYNDTNYKDESLEHKKQLVADFLSRVKPVSVWDLGANTGLFSRVAAEQGSLTVAFDIDPAAVERNYLDCRAREEERILPLVVDLANPSPGIGWENEERDSLIKRGPCDTALALALVHHLAIGNNLPLGMIARFLARVCRTLVIEFVPKSDSQVRRLLTSREDIFPGYTQQAFEAEFAARFKTVASAPIRDSERTLYLMEARPS